jgi:hypothetical protein
MNVYIVYCTDRYDGNDKVIAVFTQEYLAERALLLCPDPTHYNRYYYREEKTDLISAPHGCRPYRVLVREGTVVEMGILRFLENSDLYAPIMDTVDSTPPDLAVYCWASDTDHARQLALDMTLTHLKDGPRT